MKTITLTIDPLDKHPDLEQEHLMYLLANVPNWLSTYDATKEARPLHEYMADCYGYGGSPMTGGTITIAGVYKYPDDPELYPLAYLRCGEHTVIAYPHEIFAIIEDNSQPPTGDNVKTYRFD